jgi:Ca-activated chloride channel homolog
VHAPLNTRSNRKSQDVLTGPPGLLFGLTLLIFFAARLAFGSQIDVVNADGVPPEGEVREIMHHVESAIHNQVAATRHSFQIYNSTDEQVEVTFDLSLVPKEIIDGFSYYNGAEKIVGEVLEKQIAEEVYKELTGIHRDPGLLVLDRNHFTFCVFPVEPGETKPVEVRTITTMEMREGVVEYLVPQENLPTGKTIFSLKMEISDDLPIGEIETIGFKGRVERLGPSRAKITFEGSGDELDGPLKIRYRLKSEDYDLRLVTYREGEADGSFMLLVSPKNGADPGEIIGRDIVFVIDRSGSMEGEPLSQTKRALERVLTKLNADDRFDVISFDDEPRALFGALKRAEDRSLDEAQKAARALESGGGTNIKDALGMAMDELEKEESDRPQAIIFLTDGQGNNPPEVVLAEVRRRGETVRVFSFGAGNGVNRPFLDRLARDNRGIATFVDHSNQIEKEVTRLYERIAMPLMMDLEVEFEGLDVHSIYPRRLPDLYQDGQVVIFGRYSRPGFGEIKVRGKLKGRSHVLSLDAHLPEHQEDYAHVEKLWAGKRIEHLMDTIRTRGENDGELVKEVTRLGIVYNVATEYTSFVAVPESEQTSEIKELLRQGKRGYDKRLIDGMDSVRLSMRNLPPGDPVLSVVAPEDAQMVVAYFPFGLVKQLTYDRLRRHWTVRFLVPRVVNDGIYTIQLQILHADGTIEWKTVDYVIDSAAPEFEAFVPPEAPAGSTIEIEIDPFEIVREAFAYLPGVDEEPVPLTIDLETGNLKGFMDLPDEFADDYITLRIVVRDLAFNTFERDFEIYEIDIHED